MQYFKNQNHLSESWVKGGGLLGLRALLLCYDKLHTSFWLVK